jgi:hypothetical protein
MLQVKVQSGKNEEECTVELRGTAKSVIRVYPLNIQGR